MSKQQPKTQMSTFWRVRKAPGVFDPSDHVPVAPVSISFLVPEISQNGAIRRK